MSPPTSNAFRIASFAILTMAFLLVLIGHLLGRPSRKHFGRTSPTRLLAEIIILSILLLLPFYAYSKSGLVFSFYTTLLITPLWAAARLDNEQRLLGGGKWPRETLALLASSTFIIWLWSLLLYNRKEALAVSISLALGVTLGFLFFRGIAELIALAAVRVYRPSLLKKDSAFVLRWRNAVVWCILASLLLWGIGVVLSYQHRPFYISPVARQFSGATRLQHSTLGYSIASWLPPLFILFMGLFLARTATRETSLLCSLLCLLFGFCQLDTFPVSLGPALWTVQVFAAIFIPPVLIHFTFLFPNSEELVDDALSPAWVSCLRALYFFSLILAPAALFLAVHATGEQNLSRPIWLSMVAVAVAAFRAAITPLAYCVWVYLIVATFVKLGRSYRESTMLSTSGCEWLDLVEGRTAASFLSRLALARKQLALALAGSLVTGSLLIIWYYLVSIGSVNIIAALLNEWSIALFFLILFLAIVRYRLFEIGPSLVREFLWVNLSLLILIAGPPAMSSFQSLVFAMLKLGGILAAYISLNYLLPVLYGKVWRKKALWHAVLDAKGRALPDRPSNYESLAHLLAESTPADASAAWLFWRNADTFEMHEIAHKPACTGRCRPRFIERIALTELDGPASLPARLSSALEEIERMGAERILITQELLRPALPSFADFLMRLRGKRRFFLDEEGWSMLSRAKVSALVLLGGRQRLFGVYMIGSDPNGDYYDKLDKEELSDFADRVSIFAAQITTTNEAAGEAPAGEARE